MSKIHFGDEEYGEWILCNTKYVDDIEITEIWNHVTCKKCLAKKEKYKKWHEENEKEIIKQMGEMSEFVYKNKSMMDLIIK